MRNAEFRACVKCNRIQPMKNFQRQKGGTAGHRPECRMCRSRELAPGNTSLHYANLYYFKGQPSEQQLNAHVATDAARLAYMQCLLEEAQAMGHLDQAPLPEAGQAIGDFVSLLVSSSRL